MGTLISMVHPLVMDRLTIDTRSPVPSYRQLADQLRRAIVSGQIQPDEPLPSLSRIQQETGLAVKTIRQGIGVLVDEGLAYVVPGRGTYAARKDG